jgi:hypothetical protein
MKMLACLLLVIQFVYVLVLKLAAFMASALVILLCISVRTGIDTEQLSGAAPRRSTSAPS